jgi:hypothetical protein
LGYYFFFPFNAFIWLEEAHSPCEGSSALFKVYCLNDNLILKIPSQWHLDWCLTNYLGTVARPSRPSHLQPQLLSAVIIVCFLIADSMVISSHAGSSQQVQ